MLLFKEIYNQTNKEVKDGYLIWFPDKHEIGKSHIEIFQKFFDKIVALINGNITFNERYSKIFHRDFTEDWDDVKKRPNFRGKTDSIQWHFRHHPTDRKEGKGTKQFIDYLRIRGTSGKVENWDGVFLFLKSNKKFRNRQFNKEKEIYIGIKSGLFLSDSSDIFSPKTECLYTISNNSKGDLLVNGEILDGKKEQEILIKISDEFVNEYIKYSSESTLSSSSTEKTTISKPLSKRELNMLEKYFQSKGFLFEPHQIFSFYTALKTKGFVILSGLSGTGKTKMAQLFVELLCKNNHTEEDTYKRDCNHLFLSVRPDWKDSKSLIGFHNPLKCEKDGTHKQCYESTNLLKFIIEAGHNLTNPYFLILDEMNLAHVEHYFSDFLSVLESGRDEKNGFTKESIKLHSTGATINGVDMEIQLPPNLYIIGTINIDETTYQFSPKVLDRAFTIEFNQIDLDKYPFEGEIENPFKEEKNKELLFKHFTNDGQFLKSYANKKVIQNNLIEFKKDEKRYKRLVNLNKKLLLYDLGFGFRVIDELALFFNNGMLPEEIKNIVPVLEPNEVLDLGILMKILPKFHGNLKKLKNPLYDFMDLIKEGDHTPKLQEVDLAGEMENVNSNYIFPNTAKKILRMLIKLYRDGYTSFS